MPTNSDLSCEIHSQFMGTQANTQSTQNWISGTAQASEDAAAIAIQSSSSDSDHISTFSGHNERN
jgi:hypothetical protein